MSIGNENVEPVDLTNCDREPIHLLGRVQEFGFLVAVTNDWLIANVSANIDKFVEVSAEALIGEHISALIAVETVHSLRNRLQNVLAGSLPDVIAGVSVVPATGSARFDLNVHVSSGKILLEFEPQLDATSSDRHLADVQQAIGRISKIEDVSAMLKYATRFAGALTGFDRVMAYVFRQDETGEVIAETLAHGMEPYLGLRYPATDIPKQARALYVHNPVRTIGDSSSDGIDILPYPTSQGDAIDLSHAVLRSVSPIHLEYLRNMGVAASLSISLVVEGRLWGLLACHHREPKYLSQPLRNSLVLFGQMLSLMIAGKLSNQGSQYKSRAADLISAFSRSAITSGELAQVLVDRADLALEMMNAAAMAVVSNGDVRTIGTTPTNEEIKLITKRLNAMPPGEVFQTNELVSLLPQAADFIGRGAGMLAIPISRTPRDYILFFRPEVRKKVNWAGDPNKPVTVGPNGARLTPRKSFEVWQATVEGQSEDWSTAEIAAAEQFRITVLEVVLRMADETATERKRASEKQELLIAELNHRVRNILSLVRSLISQTSKNSASVADFSKVLESRIQALARAHDQITRQNWTAASLKDLIAAEADVYLLDKASRVVMIGNDVKLVPVAYSNLALVVHELMTNSAKYGAMSDGRGKVTITLNKRDDGSLDIGWQEEGGPPVQAPTRRGFGSTIVETTIPFELRGEANVDYELDGLKARFWLPAMHISAEETEADNDKPVSGSSLEAGGKRDADGPFPQSILLVEDNLLIAMDTESVLHELGATSVQVVPDVSSAISHINQQVPDFALLDINLGAETSVKIAQKLKELGVPVVFASGYGDSVPIAKELASIPILTKPYDKEGLRQAVLSVFD